MTKKQRALALAKSSATSARKRAAEITKSSARKVRDVRKAAKDDARAAELMTAIEAPVGGALAGVLDSYTDPLMGLLPYSAPAGIATVIAGRIFKVSDLTRVGAGMLAGSAYGLASALTPYGDGSAV